MKTTTGLLFTLSAFSLAFWSGRALTRAADPSQGVADVNRLVARPKEGVQLVAIYVGSSRCGPSNAPESMSGTAQAFDAIRGRSVAKGFGFVTIGIAREFDPQSGLHHLAQVYNFDEVSSGQSHLNQASIRFISRDHAGFAATPQIIVVERRLKKLGWSIDDVDFDERVLVRKTGVGEIMRWVKAGTPIPEIPQDAKPFSLETGR